MYEVFEHTADLGLRVRAPTLDALFADAARGLCAILVANLDAVRGVQEKSYEIVGRESDLLLFDWLNELLCTFEADRFLLVEFDVHVDELGLRAVCRGEPIDPARHELDHEVKAITYHELKVERASDGWFAEVVVDI
jgi:SHS2 domain-containing protein